MKKQILFVDDEQPVLDALRRMLRCHRDVWEITCVNHAASAWELLLEHDFDVVVSDIKMPGMSGLELLDRIQRTEQTRDIPVIMLTSLSSRQTKRQALDLGAADLLNKPVEPEDLVSRLRAALRLKAFQDRLKLHNRLLKRRVQQRSRDLAQARLDIIWRLGKAAEHRDDATGNHVIRVGCMSRVIAETLGMDHDFIETLSLAAPLHDIGKIGVPDAILRKPGPLTPEEAELMKQHCRIGARILSGNSKARIAFRQWRGLPAQPNAESRGNPVLEMGATIALLHHEKWDGTGYPRGLRGEEIPLEAGIVAISDVFDAMTSERPYKARYDEERALHVIRNKAKTHFVPEAYSAFMAALPEIRSIRQRFGDDLDPCAGIEETIDEAALVCR